MSPPVAIDWSAIPGPIVLPGDDRIAYRDPAAHYHDGLFRLFHTQVHREADGRHYLFLGVTESRDLVTWTPPRTLTPRDPERNFSSPGNIVRFADRWLLCLQTYPTPHDEPYGNGHSRIWTMASRDLVAWSEPEIMRVKGSDVPIEGMGRMIDPYLIRDKDDPRRWWCFYKQRGASMAHTTDFRTWTPFGRVEAGENACVLIDGDEYVLIHSPDNGIGVKRSTDLVSWRDLGVTTLGQRHWPWAQGRLTAGHILDLRAHPQIGRFVMFFHGTPVEATRRRETHGAASIGLAWSDDLTAWHWPG